MLMSETILIENANLTIDDSIYIYGTNKILLNNTEISIRNDFTYLFINMLYQHVDSNEVIKCVDNKSCIKGRFNSIIIEYFTGKPSCFSKATLEYGESNIVVNYLYDQECLDILNCKCNCPKDQTKSSPLSEQVYPTVKSEKYVICIDLTNFGNILILLPIITIFAIVAIIFKFE